jgi:hypothetical protein
MSIYNICPLLSFAQLHITQKGIRRFASPNKQTRSVCRACKMWRNKPPQRAFQRLAHARLVVYVARAAVRRRSVYRVLGDVCAVLQIFFIYICYFNYKLIFIFFFIMICIIIKNFQNNCY